MAAKLSTRVQSFKVQDVDDFISVSSENSFTDAGSEFNAARSYAASDTGNSEFGSTTGLSPRSAPVHATRSPFTTTASFERDSKRVQDWVDKVSKSPAHPEKTSATRGSNPRGPGLFRAVAKGVLFWRRPHKSSSEIVRELTNAIFKNVLEMHNKEEAVQFATAAEPEDFVDVLSRYATAETTFASDTLPNETLEPAVMESEGTRAVESVLSSAAVTADGVVLPEVAGKEPAPAPAETSVLEVVEHTTGASEAELQLPDLRSTDNSALVTPAPALESPEDPPAPFSCSFAARAGSLPAASSFASSVPTLGGVESLAGVESILERSAELLARLQPEQYVAGPTDNSDVLLSAELSHGLPPIISQDLSTISETEVAAVGSVEGPEAFDAVTAKLAVAGAVSGIEEPLAGAEIASGVVNFGSEAALPSVPAVEPISAALVHDPAIASISTSAMAAVMDEPVSAPVASMPLVDSTPLSEESNPVVEPISPTVLAAPLVEPNSITPAVEPTSPLAVAGPVMEAFMASGVEGPAMEPNSAPYESSSGIGPIKPLTESAPAAEPIAAPDVSGPVVEEVAPVVSKVAPLEEEVVSVVDEVAPLAVDMALRVNEVAPMVGGAAAVVDEVAPVVGEVATTVDKLAPVVDEVAAMDDKVATVVKVVTPLVEVVTSEMEVMAPEVEAVAIEVEAVSSNEARTPGSEPTSLASPTPAMVLETAAVQSLPAHVVTVLATPDVAVTPDIGEEVLAAAAQAWQPAAHAAAEGKDVELPTAALQSPVEEAAAALAPLVAAAVAPAVLEDDDTARSMDQMEKRSMLERKDTPFPDDKSFSKELPSMDSAREVHYNAKADTIVEVAPPLALLPAVSVGLPLATNQAVTEKTQPMGTSLVAEMAEVSESGPVGVPDVPGGPSVRFASKAVVYEEETVRSKAVKPTRGLFSCFCFSG